MLSGGNPALHDLGGLVDSAAARMAAGLRLRPKGRLAGLACARSIASRSRRSLLLPVWPVRRTGSSSSASWSSAHGRDEARGPEDRLLRRNRSSSGQRTSLRRWPARCRSTYRLALRFPLRRIFAAPLRIATAGSASGSRRSGARRGAGAAPTSCDRVGGRDRRMSEITITEPAHASADVAVSDLRRDLSRVHLRGSPSASVRARRPQVRSPARPLLPRGGPGQGRGWSRDRLGRRLRRHQDRLQAAPRRNSITTT